MLINRLSIPHLALKRQNGALSAPHVRKSPPTLKLILYKARRRRPDRTITGPRLQLSAIFRYTSTPSIMSKFEHALQRIDAAHKDDPNTITINDTTIPYEFHYAQKMTDYLIRLNPHASDTLRLAIRAQHLRRWEIPRASYPATKVGYHAWRGELQRRQAKLAEDICLESGYAPEEAARVSALIRKADLKKGDTDTQTLEDVACLVFLDDQFDKFESDLGDEDKIIDILKKTWAKMSEAGRKEALKINLSERGNALVQKALSS